MKTTTIRLDDDVVEVLEAATETTGQTPSDVIRLGLRLALAHLAAENDDFRDRRNEIMQRRIDAVTRETQEKLGADSPVNISG